MNRPSIFVLARLPRTEAITLYLRVHRLNGGAIVPGFAAMSRDQLAAAIDARLAGRPS